MLHRTPSVSASRPSGPRIAAAVARAPERRRRRTPRADAADEAASPRANDDTDDPDPAVVRLLEAHALETSAGCFGLAQRLRTTATATATAAATATATATGAAADLVAAAHIQADIEAREAALVHSLLACTGRLQAGAPGALGVARGAAALSTAAALPSAFRALQALKRAPELLGVPGAELARRVLALKLALPGADVSALVSARPALLLLGPPSVVTSVVGGAAAQMSALMPGIPWQRKLAEGGAAYWSFASVLDTCQGRARELAAEAEAEEQEKERRGRQQREAGGGGAIARSSSPSSGGRGEEQRQPRPPLTHSLRHHSHTDQ